MSIGKVRVALPSDFHGVLTLFTTNSKHILGPELQAHSVRITLEEAEDERTVGYQINGPGGESFAALRTTNGTVKAGFTGDSDTDGGCVVC